MYSLAKFIVRMRKVFSLIFIALIVFSAFSISWVNVENDITTYLADDFEAKRGLNLMKREFVAYATADIMVENISRETAREIYNMLSDTYGVMMVSYDSGPGHYKDHSALYNITFEGKASAKPAINAMARVKRQLEGYDYCVKSDSFSNLTEIIATEMQGVLVIVIFVVVGVLVFTSTTYAEVLVLLGTFLAAAIINMGTNYLFGTISFVSNSVAIVLQLALSVDYAIIFCNRYKEEHETKGVEEAVVSALSLSIPEIFASSLTTIAGLAAMTFMQFRLGFDMGICLIKAIVLSLLSVFLLMPALLMGLGDLMDRTKHRSFVPKISFVGRFAYKSRFIIPPLFIILVIFGYMSFGRINYAYSMDLVDCIHRNEEDIAAARINERFGESNTIAVIVPSGDHQREAALIEELKACDEVDSVLGLASVEAMNGYKLTDSIDYKEFMDLAGVEEQAAQALFAYYASGADYREAVDNLDTLKAPLLDIFLVIHDMQHSGKLQLTKEQKDMVDSLYSQLSMATEQLQSENYSRIIVRADLPTQGEETFRFLDRVHVIAGQYYDDVTVTGGAVSAKDFNSSFAGDTKIVSVLSIGFVMLILLVTFKSLGMPLLLILVIQGSIWLNFAISVWSGSYVFFMCYLIVSAIQMGANIDYAIVISSRYNELRKNGVHRRDAAVETLNLAFPTVITSGLMMVIAGLLIGTRVSQVVIAGMGLYVGTGTAITLVLVNFVLPQILIFGDGFVRATEIKIRASRRRAAAAVLACAAVLSLVSVGVFAPKTAAEHESETDAYTAAIEQIRAVKPHAETVRSENSDYNSAKLDFAEHVVTDIVGGAMLSDGQKEYDDGVRQLKDAKGLVENGSDLYYGGQAQYEEGLAAYNDGMRQLQEGKELYAEKQQLLEDSKKQLEAGKLELAMGEAQLTLMEPLYRQAAELQAQYEENLALAEEAAANGDTEAEQDYRSKADRYAALLNAGIGGYSMETIISEYESGLAAAEEGRAQIAEAETAISEGEIALAEAKQQIEDNEKLLADTKELLDSAAKQLEASKYDLDNGIYQMYKGQLQLDAAGEELENGRKTLEENREKLNDDIAALDAYSAQRSSLEELMTELKKLDGIAQLTTEDGDSAELCSAAELLYQKRIENSERKFGMLKLIIPMLVLAALTGLAAVVIRKAAPVLASVSALLALISLVLWCIFCKTYIVFAVAAMLLALCAAVYAVLSKLKTA